MRPVPTLPDPSEGLKTGKTRAEQGAVLLDLLRIGFTLGVICGFVIGVVAITLLLRWLA